MRKLLVSIVAALAFLAPAQARAVVFLGARVGYALPSGDAQQGTPMKDSISAQIPIQLDVGMSVLSIMSAGVYASYGPTRVASELKSSPLCAGVTCSGQNLRAGLQLNFRPPVVMNSLWGGIFAGYEEQRVSVVAGGLKLRGWEAGLQAGYDFSVLPLLKMGPYASYSFAQFTSASGPVEITSQAQHNAFTFGLRGLFDC
jgi:hypothetical protein